MILFLCNCIFLSIFLVRLVWNSYPLGLMPGQDTTTFASEVPVSVIICCAIASSGCMVNILKRVPPPSWLTIQLFSHVLYIGLSSFLYNTRIIFSNVMSTNSTSQICYGCVLAQAVSRRLPTTAAWAQSEVISYGICGVSSGTRTGSLPALQFPLPIILSSGPHSLTILLSDCI
jgi:hypothetical protein